MRKCTDLWSNARMGVFPSAGAIRIAGFTNVRGTAGRACRALANFQYGSRRVLDTTVPYAGFRRGRLRSLLTAGAKPNARLLSVSPRNAKR